MIRYALTTFLSAFLLFQVQPMIGRLILPWFGGTPTVWTTCLLFFQAALLGGYLYAHVLVDRLQPRAQGLVHLAALALSLVALPIAPDPSLRPTDPSEPTWRILLLLLGTVGVPYGVLATTGPLLQSWFTHQAPGRSPYRLYALSNLGSLLALLSYPFLVEPALSLSAQTTIWSWGYVLFGVSAGGCALSAVRAGGAHPRPQETGGFEETQVEGPSLGRRALWLALAACPSALLLATTHQLCQEVAVFPFLWVLPLTLYLVSFILTFEGDRWYRPGLWGSVLAVGIVGWGAVMVWGYDAAWWRQMLVGGGTFLAACMVCHGELARMRPSHRHLTAFYLSLSAGGAIGGAMVALLAPRLFTQLWELPLALLGAWVLFMVAQYGRRDSSLYQGARPRVWGLMAGVFWVAAFVLAVPNVIKQGETTATARNFYGVLRVYDVQDGEAGPRRILKHGRVQHGQQLLDGERRRWPTAYYGPGSGVALAIERHPKRMRGEALRVGIIGLGVGVVAAWGVQGDTFRFYEINPDVIRFAEDAFSFLRESSSRIEVVAGDGRIALEQDLGKIPAFDVLVVDAFSSDAIPVHLLTREAGDIYWRALAPDGVLAIHISNKYLDLKPVVRGLPRPDHARVLHIENPDAPSRGVLASGWMLIGASQAFLTDETLNEVQTPPLDVPRVARWTDDHSDLLGILQ